MALSRSIQITVRRLQSLRTYSFTRASFSTSIRSNTDKKRILIFGSNGTIGSKVAQHWMKQNKHELLLVDRDPAIAQNKQCMIAADLTHHHIQLDLVNECNTDATKSTLCKLVAQNDVIIPLAAKNPFCDATWEEVVYSLDILNNILLSCTTAHNLSNNKKTRIIYSSSNHALGGYLQEGATLSKAIENGYHDTAALDPKQVHLNPGTRFTLANGYGMDSTPYSMPKVFTERLALSLCYLYPQNIESVILRIGWNQPGVNHPSTLSAIGKHGDNAEDAKEEMDKGKNESVEDEFDKLQDCEQWFRHMWLSNEDMYQLFDRAVEHTFGENVSPKYTICNGVSNNSDSRWSIANDIGYKPVSNVNDYE